MTGTESQIQRAGQIRSRVDMEFVPVADAFRAAPLIQPEPDRSQTFAVIEFPETNAPKRWRGIRPARAGSNPKATTHTWEKAYSNCNSQ